MNIQKFTTFKTILIALVLTINANQLFAQTTNGIFFQAVARDNFSNPAKDRKIYVQSSIIQTTPTGTKVLTEEHQANTDATGVFSISLGNGVRVGGTASSLTTIDWSKGPFYLNLKVAITPIGGNSTWDYTKEWVDMGTTSFGAVPFALYSASSAKVDDKLNITDTSKMLAIYAKAMTVKTLETSLATKLTAADTLTMLAPYAKAAYTIDSTFFKTQLATKLSLTDTINYTKQKYTDSAIAKKLNIADSAIYVTKTQLAAKTFDQTPITNAIATKLNIADSTKYVTPTQLAAKTFDQTPITNSIATKLNIADSTKYVTPTQLAAKTFDTTSLSSRINLKAAASDVTSAINAEATTARAAELVLTNNITSNTASITANAAAISAEATTARAAELVLTNNITSNTASITANAAAINAEATTARAAELVLTNNITSNTASITSNAAAITAEATTARAAELVLTNNITSNTASITANAAAISAEATTARAAELVLTNNITSNTSSITANAAAITAEATTARAAELILTNNIASSTSSITAINTILSEATSSNNANTLVKRDASGNLSAGSITASNYASTPISLSYTGSTINWNPTTGANAAITLTQNSTLSFSATPLVGSYGTVVLTQDGTGNRTITLPTIVGVTNKVLGSSSETSIALSTSASAKDILNFYYDGTNCYWNIGQGYGNAPTASFTLTTTGTGAATLSGTTLNIPSVSSTVNAGSISGTIAVVNGGTGATTLTGYVKGTGTTAMTASGSIPVADVTGAAPLASPTFTGTVTTSTINTGALSATSVTTPIYASTPQALTDGATISWNPTLGLNASVTLAGNRTLSFTSTPAAGSYGTLVVTQDATGGRTITLPSTTNKVLGSTSGTTIALSSAANAKDILNFYYDGTNCYWNIGQGYGAAATAPFTLTTTGTGAATLSGTTLNIPSVSSTVNAGSISGTIAVANGGTGVTTSTGTGNVVLSTSPTLITPALGTPSAVVLTSATGLPLTTGVTGTLAVGNGGTGATTLTGYVKGTGTTAMTASGSIPVADVTGAAPLASPTFTGTVTTSTINTGALSATSVTTPIYASTPQALTDGATISWNPTLGLNASVTLAGNRTLSFTSTPAVGSYGTVVLTQDGTGGRTITLPTIPSVTNKVLGSATNTTVSLSTAANAKDILNFYYDGTNCYWNIGQGYGNAATITANNIAGGAAGSIPYQTGAGATGFLAKGTDGQILTLASGVPSWTAASATGVTSVAMSTPTGLSVSGSPITSSGTLALSLSTGYAIPTTTSQTNWDAAYSNRITSANSPLSITSNALSLATVPVSSGGTGATTLTSGSLLKGNGTSAISAATAGTDYSAGTSTLLTGILKSTTITGALTIAAASDFPTLNQNTTGNASTATKLAASKNINGVAFDGSSDITVTAAAGTLSGTVAVANGGTGATTLTSGSLLKGNGTSAISAATAGTDYSAGTSTLLTGILKSTTITGALTIAAASDFPTLNQNTTGNASTATKLAASKNINGVAFDGSSDITISASAGTLSGTVAVANGGTGLTSTPGNGQIDIGNGSGFTRANLTPGTAITITNASGAITISAAIRPTSDEFTATAGQTAFTLTQTPLTNTTTNPVKPNVWMFINGVRTKNSAYAVSGTSVTYTASSNNSYTLVAGDRIQFDYAY